LGVASFEHRAIEVESFMTQLFQPFLDLAKNSTIVTHLSKILIEAIILLKESGIHDDANNRIRTHATSWTWLCHRCQMRTSDEDVAIEELFRKL
jgi:hypothetical protein